MVWFRKKDFVYIFILFCGFAIIYFFGGVTTADRFNFSPDEVISMTELAKKGDVQANRSLDLYYDYLEYYEYNEDKFAKRINYLRETKQVGDIVGKLALIYNVIYNGSETDVVKVLSIINNIKMRSDISEQERYKTARAYELGVNALSGNLPKALYYSKLESCEEKEPYSYGAYLDILYRNYSEDKEYMKVAYAMLLSTKFKAENYYKYSNFETIEQNISKTLNENERRHILTNYQQIINDECSAIMSDHSQIPSEDKLIQYAYPLKSDTNKTIGH